MSGPRDPNDPSDEGPAMRRVYACARCEWTGDNLAQLGEHLFATRHEPAEPREIVGAPV